jgi:hypothetical protein
MRCIAQPKSKTRTSKLLALGPWQARFLEIALLFVCLDHLANGIVKADHKVM